MAIIEVSGLGKSFGPSRAVVDVSFDVRRGEVLGLLGPNGAGKTTTVECTVGLLARDAGEVRVLGVDPGRDRATVRRRVGVQLQQARLPAALTVAEAVRLFASCHDEPADPDELLATLGLTGCARTRCGRLSGGQQQRVSIALALVGDPAVVVLDELTTGLDPVSRRETWALVEAVRDRGVTVLLVTHDMAEAERLCDRLVVVAGGRVVAAGTPAEVTAGAGGRTLDDAVVALTGPRPSGASA